MNCELAYLVIDLQILGRKNKRPWLHVYFNLALAQDAAEEEHLSRHPNKYPVPSLERTDGAHQVSAQAPVAVQWGQGDHVAVAIGKTGLTLCQI